MITRLLLLGATGDLAGRFLFPPLAELSAPGGPLAGLQLVGAAEQDSDDAGFAAHVAARLDEHAADLPADVRREFAASVRYRRVVLDDPATLTAALQAFDDGDTQAPVAVYLALPPVLFPAAVTALGRAGLPPGSRIAVEKPFGRDLAGARELNALLAEATGGSDRAAFRVDHFLAMPAVRSLPALRTPGTPLAPLWNAEHVTRVDVLWEETLDVGGRGGFYDATGAVRDVLQNHLVQVLALLAMEPPATGTDADLQRARLDLLRAVRVLDPADPAGSTRRARYTASAGDRPVPGYAGVDGVDPARGTETFAEVALAVDTPRWAGTPFVLRTGKAMAADRKRVVLHLRGPAPAACPPGVEPAGDRLEIALDGARQLGSDVAVHAPGERTAYGTVLSDVLAGGTGTAVSAAEAEQAWRFVDPVLRAWAEQAVPLLEYPAGTAGPPPLLP